MEKDIFTGMQLVALKPEKEQKREKITVMRQKQGVTYDPKSLKEALQELRDFIAFDLSSYLSNDITAKALSDKILVLDFLVRGVEFEEMEVLV